MVRSVLYLEPRAGDYDAVVDYLRRTRVLEDAAHVDGFVSSELQIPLGGGPLLVTALWRDRHAYERWVGHPARAQSADGLAQLVEGGVDAGSRGALYEVVLEQRATGEDVAA
jgi:heme-degrading monooxygenase HmoA